MGHSQARVTFAEEKLYVPHIHDIADLFDGWEEFGIVPVHGNLRLGSFVIVEISRGDICEIGQKRRYHV